jgi:hypothetical protein
MSKQPPTIPETITSEAQAVAAGKRLGELRTDADHWRAERARVAIARGEMLATASTASLAEAGRLSARLSMGDADQADRAQIIAALSGRLARWDAGAADRARAAAETALELAYQIAQGAEDAFADAALAMVSAKRELAAAEKTLKAAYKVAGKIGIDVSGYPLPASPNRLISSLMAPAGLGAEADSGAIVDRWQNPPQRHGFAAPARRERLKPQRNPRSGDAATYFGGYSVTSFRVVREEAGSPAA